MEEMYLRSRARILKKENGEDYFKKTDLKLEYLSMKDLNDNFKNMKACESLWVQKEETEEMKTFLKAAYWFTGNIIKIDDDILSFKDVLNMGFVVNFKNEVFIRAVSDNKKCPYCGASILYNVKNVFGAMSRRTEEEICGLCGRMEAMEDYANARCDLFEQD